MRISRAAAFPGTISVKLSTSCSATYLLLTAVRRPPPLEVEVAPVSAGRLLKKAVYPLSLSVVATCISCARLAIPVSWSMMAKPPSWGSMPVMRCSLSLQAAGPRRRRSVSWRDRSGGTRPLRRFHERSHRASPAMSSWGQLPRIGIAAGFAGAARASGCAASAGPVPSGAHRGPRGTGGARGASPAGMDMDPGGAAPPAPGAAPGASSSPSAWLAAPGGGRRVYGACHGDLRALPCRMLVAASFSSAGAAACTACHARCSSIAPLV